MNIRKLKRNPIIAFAMGFDKLTGKILRYGVTQTGKSIVRGFKRVTKSGKVSSVKTHTRVIGGKRGSIAATSKRNRKPIKRKRKIPL